MSLKPWEVHSSAELLTPLSGLRARWAPRGGRAGNHSARSASQHREDSQTLAAVVGRYRDEHPILPLLENALGGERLRRVCSTNGGEWAGPCPLCGGEDRFRVWPTPREGYPRAWCRQCRTVGDALHWAVRLSGGDPSARGSTVAFLRKCGLLEANLVARRSGTRIPAAPRQSARSPSPLEIVAELSEALREVFEERAAIMEYEGGLSRERAEAVALRSILAH